MKFSHWNHILPFLVMASIGIGMPLITMGQAENSTENGGRKIVAAGEVIDGDYIAAGEIVEISGTVNGDVYIVGGQILVDGEINGDLLAIGNTISISGRVAQNVRVLGGQVILSGEVGRNVTLAGMNIELTSSARVEGGVVIGASTVVLASPIKKNVRVGGRNLTLSNTIDGNLDAAVDAIRLTSKAEVRGDFTYWSNRLASIDETATIVGSITRKAPQYSFSLETVLGDFARFVRPFFILASFLTTLILGLLLTRFLPGYTRATVQTLRTRRWRSLTSGITALLIIPILFGLLIITVVGIPLGFIVLTLSSVLLYGARIFVMVLIGVLILERFGKESNDMRAFIVGLIVYSLLVLIPIIGWAISFLAVLFGLGAAIQTLKQRHFSKKSTV